ncbi:MAG: ATP-binding protein [Coriobacteriia bacterium]|nr:ATP-binding protein [Coriobacteriia bacterium]
MKLIERDSYIDRLYGIKDTSEIKIITGIRRSGKSELLKSFIGKVKTEDKANIIFIDFSDLKYEPLNNYKNLNDYILEKYKKEFKNYLFIDEVQMCKNFEKTVNSIYNSKKFDIYLTGSNAFLQSSDLATLFTGRFLDVPVFPFSYKEYCKYHKKENGGCLEDYLINGGLAGSYQFKNEQDRLNYIKNVYETILQRDISDKYFPNDAFTLDNINKFLMDNIGNFTSPNKVSEILTSNNIQTNHVSTGRYIQYLCNSFLFYKASRYDMKGRKYLQTIYKYYLADLGFRYALLGMRNIDFGRAYENIVFLELLRRGYDVYVGKLYSKEIDFVATKNNEKIYIQVCADISNKATLSRELTVLQSIKDSYPKMLLSITNQPQYDVEGIIIKNIEEWLLN